MKKKNKLANFQNMKEASTGELIGGFSVVIDVQASASGLRKKNDRCTTVNNCNGGNCAAGCSTK